MRHGAAEASSSGGDAARALTAKGRADLDRAAAAVRRFGVRADAAWVSPYVRAQQTASILLPALGAPAATTKAELVPEGPVRTVADAIRAAPARTLVVVSHLPLLPGVIGALTGARVELGTGTLVHIALLGSDVPAALLGVFPLDRVLQVTEQR